MAEEVMTPIVEETAETAETTQAMVAVPVVVAEEAKEEKKDNAFSRLWKKAKRSVGNSILESKIRLAYERANMPFTLYTRGGLLPTPCSGELVDGKLTVFGRVEAKPWSVVVMDNKQKTAYYVLSTEPATVRVAIEGVTYEREAPCLLLDPAVEEVKVVRAGGRYFLYKGEDD